jgi:hypothetical protein
MPSFEYAHCPECKKWVPSDTMNYFDGLRVCNWCLNQEQEKPPHDKFVYDPNYGKARCIICDSYDTEYIEGTHPYKYKCRECGEEFIR